MILASPNWNPTAWLRTIKGPSTPLMKHALKLKVRLVRGLATWNYLIGIFMICVSREGISGKTPKPLCAHACKRWMRWITLVDHHLKGAVLRRTWRKPMIFFVGEQHVDKRYRRTDAHLNFVTNKEILEQHGQWWEKEMQLRLNTLSNL